MKRIGSKTEDDIRKELEGLQRAFLMSPARQRVVSALKARFPDFKTAHVLGWIPDGGEDSMTVLLDRQLIVTLEFDPRDPHADVRIEGTTPLHDDNGILRRRYSRIWLAVVLDFVERAG